MYLPNNFCQLEWTLESFLPVISMESGVLFISVNGKLSGSFLFVDLL